MGVFLLSVACGVIWVYSVVKILTKAGYHGAWVLVMFVPLVNLAMLYRFADADWPALRAARRRSSV